MSILRLSHIGLCVSDLERSTRFYRDLLGFEVLSELSVAGEAASRLLELDDCALEAVYLERDAVRIELLRFRKPGHRGEPGPRPMNQLGLTHLSLRVSDLQETLDRLRAEGHAVLEATRVGDPQHRSGAIFVTDPDGTRIELVEAPGPPDALPGS
ncbi:MAG: VOC family protein [Myxococcota bacterium]